MGNTIIKSLAQEVQITSSTTLYRIGNLRILRVTGTSPTNQILAEEERPKSYASGSLVCNTSDANLYGAVGRLSVNTSGVITCAVVATYYSAGSGYSILYSPNVAYGVAVWSV